MNSLNDLHSKSNENNWCPLKVDFNKSYQELNEVLDKKGDVASLKKSEAERRAISFIKTPQRGLSSQMGGKRSYDDGREEDIKWPDIKDFTNDDFEHILLMFKKCENVFLKSEFGLFLYYTSKIKTNNEVLSLLIALQELNKEYIEKIIKGSIKPFLYYRMSFENFLSISIKRKKNPEIQSLLQEELNNNSEHLMNLLVEDYASHRRFLNIFVGYLNKYRKELKQMVDFEDLLNVVYGYSNKISNYDINIFINICRISGYLDSYTTGKAERWDIALAEKYELLMDSSSIEIWSAKSYAEDALELYKKHNKNEKVKDIEKRYNELRTRVKTQKFNYELPSNLAKEFDDEIINFIDSGESKRIIQGICDNALRLEEVYEYLINEPKDSLSFLIKSKANKTIIDKFGNTIEEFSSKEESEDYNFWEVYNLMFQIGNNKLYKLFTYGIKQGKIKFNFVDSFIRDSWIGKTYEIQYVNNTQNICPYYNFKNALKELFDEFEASIDDNSRVPNFISITDSLVVKIEYLLRLMCSFNGISTFKEKEKNGHKLKMEKNLDELLASLKNTSENPTGFNEEHRVFIQFIMTKKSGLNLRNRIAHGLMDPNEYGPIYPILCLNIILMLSRYSFD